MQKLIVSILIGCIGCATLVSASEINQATIKRLMLDRVFEGKVFVQLNKHQSAPIECHDNDHWEYVLDITDDYGKAMYSTLLSLHASGKAGLFRGDETCSLYHSAETLRRVEAK